MSAVESAPHIVLSWWRLRGSQYVVRIRWFHSAGWCMVLQRHCGGGSHMAVAFLGRCCLFVSLPIQHGTVPDGDFMSWRRLLAVVVWFRSVRFTAEWSCPCRYPNSTGQNLSRGDKLCGLRRRPNPTIPSCLSCVCVCHMLMLQSNLPVLFFCLFPLLWSSRDTILFFFPTMSI